MRWKYLRILIIIHALLFTNHSSSFTNALHNRFFDKATFLKPPSDNKLLETITPYNAHDETILKSSLLLSVIQPSKLTTLDKQTALEPIYEKTKLDKNIVRNTAIKKNFLENLTIGNTILKNLTINDASLDTTSWNKLFLNKKIFENFSIYKSTTDTDTSKLIKTILNQFSGTTHKVTRTVNKKGTLDKQMLDNSVPQESTKVSFAKLTSDKPILSTSESPNKIEESETFIHISGKPIDVNPMPQPRYTPIGINCYSCSSDDLGACAQTALKSEFYILCKVTRKDSGCYTALDRKTRIITRGCLSVISKSMENYCYNEKELCEFCYNNSCNRKKVPELPEDSFDSASKLLRSFTLWGISALVLAVA